MQLASLIARSPSERMVELASQIGQDDAADWCAGLLDGSIAFDDPRRPPIHWLGGRHAAALQLKHGAAWGEQDHWPRVWAARGLLYVWRPGPRSESAVLAGLRDRAWRVREMSAKVARRHKVAAAEPRLVALLDDPRQRVRAAAEAALTSLTATE